MLADLQRAVRVRAAEGVGSVDGGCSQSLRHGHPHVDAGQVHDDRLRKVNVLTSGNGTVVPIMHERTHHGAAVGVGVKVTAESDHDPGVQHVSGSGLRQPEHTHTHIINQVQERVFACHC